MTHNAIYSCTMSTQYIHKAQLFLLQISEELEKVKQEMEEKGSSMSDGGKPHTHNKPSFMLYVSYSFYLFVCFVLQLQWWRSVRVWPSWSRRLSRWMFGWEWWSTLYYKPNSEKKTTWPETCTLHTSWSPTHRRTESYTLVCVGYILYKYVEICF